MIVVYIILAMGALFMIEGLIQLVLTLSKSRFHRRVLLILLIYVLVSSLMLFQEILYNDKALGVFNLVDLIYQTNRGVSLQLSYMANFVSVMVTDVLLFLVVFRLLDVLSKLFLSKLIVIQVDKQSDSVLIRLVSDSRCFQFKLSDLKITGLFAVSVTVLVKLSLLYFWFYAGHLQTVHLVIIMMVAIVTIFLFFLFYQSLTQMMAELFIQVMFFEKERYALVHDVFNACLENGVAQVDFEDYTLHLKQAIEFGVLIPIASVSYMELKELGRLKLYINDNLLERYRKYSSA